MCAESFLLPFLCEKSHKKRDIRCSREQSSYHPDLAGRTLDALFNPCVQTHVPAIMTSDLSLHEKARKRREPKGKAQAFGDENGDDGPKPKPQHLAFSTSTSTSLPAFDPASTSLSPPSPLLLSLYKKTLLEEELKESKGHQKPFFYGLLFLSASSFAVAARPDLVPLAFLLFALTTLPVRALSFARKKWGFFMIDFCYFANAAVAAWLVAEERGGGGGGGGGEGGGGGNNGNDEMKAAVVALAEGPLAAAALAWRCSWCPGMAPSHLISTLVHVLPGAALFAKEMIMTTTGGEAKQRSSSSPSFFGKRQAAGPAPRPQNSLLWSLQHQFLTPLLFYLAWQLLYFVVVQVLFRASILKGRHDTSYRCLARRAARADNFWNSVVRGRQPCEVTPGGQKPNGSSCEVDERLGLMPGTTAARRCLSYGGVQLVFTVSTLAAAAFVTRNRKLWSLWQVLKFAAPLWYGVEAMGKGRKKAAERRVERAHAAAVASAEAVGRGAVN